MSSRRSIGLRFQLRASLRVRDSHCPLRGQARLSRVFRGAVGHSVFGGGEVTEAHDIDGFDADGDVVVFLDVTAKEIGDDQFDFRWRVGSQKAIAWT